MVLTSQPNGITRASWRGTNALGNRESWSKREVDFSKAAELHTSILKLVEGTSIQKPQSWSVRDGSSLTIWVRRYAKSKAVEYSHESFRGDKEVKKVLTSIFQLTGSDLFEQQTQPLKIDDGEQGVVPNP